MAGDRGVAKRKNGAKSGSVAPVSQEQTGGESQDHVTQVQVPDNGESTAVGAEQEQELAENDAADAADADDVEAENDTDGVKAEQAAKRSRAKLTMEKLLEFAKECAVRKQKLSFRVIHAHLGGSHSTIARLMNQLDTLRLGEIDIPISLSQATEDAIRADINRHLELYRERHAESMKAVADAREDMELMIELFEALYNELID